MTLSITVVLAILTSLLLLRVHGHLEITPVKYGILKAMACQSKRADRALRQLLQGRNDCKIINKEFKRVEKIYITDLNRYLFQFNGAGSIFLRREILREDRLTL